MYVVGVDSGGTKTTVAIANVDGKVLGVTTGMAGNFQVVGLPQAKSNLKIVLKDALRNAGVKESEVLAYFFGMAGADTPYDRSVVESILRDMNLRNYAYENDGYIALKSAFGDDPGIVVTCGTGSISYAFDGKDYNRIGGYSWFYGERLGGYYLAGLVMSAAMRAKDGRGKPTVMLEMIEEKAKMDVEELTIFPHAQDMDPPFDMIPTLIDILKEAYEDGDEVAREIMGEIAEEVVTIVRAHERKLSFENPPKVSLDGTCFKVLKDEIVSILNGIDGHEYFVPEHDPVVGALYEALKMAGRIVPVDVIASSYLEVK